MIGLIKDVVAFSNRSRPALIYMVALEPYVVNNVGDGGNRCFNYLLV